MSRSVRLLVCFFAATGVLTLPTWANATQGYFTIGTGAVNDGLAGAGVALAQDASAGAVNPAGIVKLGNQYTVDGTLFQPSRQYKVNGNPSGDPHTFGLAPGTVKSNNNTFGIPDLGYSHRLSLDSALGINIYANGGLNTDYPGSAGGGFGTFGAGGAGVNLEQLFIVPSYSRALGDKWDVGVSLVGAYEIFSATGLANFAVDDQIGTNTHLTNNGNDTSFAIGGKIGALYQATPVLAFGAVYQTETSGGKFDKYSNLFADNGSFNVPATTTAGLAWKTSPKTTLAFDAQYIQYSQIAAVSNAFSNLLSGHPLGSSGGPGFGWKDTTFYKLGYQIAVSPTWTVRGGIAYGKQPLGSSEVLFNILAPGVTEWHYALGATAKVTKKSDLSLAVVYAPTTSVSGANPLEAPRQQTIQLSMHQFEAEAGYSVKY